MSVVLKRDFLRLIKKHNKEVGSYYSKDYIRLNKNLDKVESKKIKDNGLSLFFRGIYRDFQWYMYNIKRHKHLDDIRNNNRDIVDVETKRIKSNDFLTFTGAYLYIQIDYRLFEVEGEFIHDFVVNNISKNSNDYYLFLNNSKKYHLLFLIKILIGNAINLMFFVLSLFWTFWIVILSRETFDYSNGNNAHIYIIEYTVMPILTIFLLVGGALWMYFLAGIKVKPFKNNKSDTKNTIIIYGQYLDEVFEKVKSMPEALVNEKLNGCSK